MFALGVGTFTLEVWNLSDHRCFYPPPPLYLVAVMGSSSQQYGGDLLYTALPVLGFTFVGIESV